MNHSDKSCNCYVALLPEMVRFSVRYGAHQPECPKYRESADPVDRANDIEYRQLPRVHGIPRPAK